MKSKKSEGRRLVQKAIDEPLNAEEMNRLQAYEATDEGRSYKEVHTYLRDELPEGLPELTMNKQKLRAVVAQIDERVQRKRRVQRMVHTTRSVVLATAVSVLLFLGYNWLAPDSFSPEPAAAPVTSRPAPTPTLAPLMKYALLPEASPEPLAQIDSGLYTQTIAQTAAEVEYDIHIPLQLNSDISFVGAMVNPEHGAVEIALRNASKVYGMHRLWILSQLPVASEFPGQELVTAHKVQKLPWDETILEKVEFESQSVEMFGVEGVYGGREMVFSVDDSIFINTLSWQVDGRQYRLTVVSPTPITPKQMKTAVQDWYLVPFER